MTSLIIASIALSCIVAGCGIGMLLRKRIPDHHTRDDSKDIIKTVAGMMATLVALVIGLLVSSAKSSFDAANAGITSGGAKVITLDRLLARYGPEAKAARDQLRKSVEDSIRRVWPADGSAIKLAGPEEATEMEKVFDRLRELDPKNDAQRYLQIQSVGIGNELMQTNWTLVEQSQNSLPILFLVALISWLTVLYAIFGILTPWNRTTGASLFISALSMAGAIFLILELNRPMAGMIKVPSAPLDNALLIIGK